MTKAYQKISKPDFNSSEVDSDENSTNSNSSDSEVEVNYDRLASKLDDLEADEDDSQSELARNSQTTEKASDDEFQDFDEVQLQQSGLSLAIKPLAKYIESQRATFELPKIVNSKAALIDIFTDTWDSLFKNKTPELNQSATDLLGILEQLMSQPHYGNKQFSNGLFVKKILPTAEQTTAWGIKQLERLGGETKKTGGVAKPAATILERLQQKANDPEECARVSEKIRTDMRYR